MGSLGDEHKSSINKDKGMQTQAYGNGKKVCYNFPTLKVYPPLTLHNGSIYSPQMGKMEGRIEAFLGIWQAKDQIICYLMRKTTNIFWFLP